MACQPAMKHADGAVSRYMVFSHAAGMQLVDSVTECEDICLGLDFCWIDIANPTTQELLDLGEAFQLHALTVEDIVNESDRDKIDVFDDYIYIVYRAIRSTYGMSESEMLTAGSVGDDACAIASDHFAILLRENAIITIHHDARRQHTYPVISRLVAIHSAVAGDSSVLAGLTVFPPYVAYAIIDEITDHMSPRIVEIERQVDAIDELVLLLTQTEQEDMLRRIGERRRQILCMWRLVQAKPEIIHTLVRVIQSDSVLPQLGDEVAQYLGDVSDHLMAILNTCSHAETVLARAHSNYLAKISLELSRATFNSNATTERWTMLGTIVVPINIVTSFLGVNLKIPGQDRDDTLNFFIVMACMAVYTITTLAFWRWRKVL
ncbi:CorA metal ion transporter [Linderina pennispora]|nr:CorA metal ion transporter [Linderina pennispora]